MVKCDVFFSYGRYPLSNEASPGGQPAWACRRPTYLVGVVTLPSSLTLTKI